MCGNLAQGTLMFCLVLAGLTVYVQAFELNILHTNDFHARIQEISKYSGACSPEASAEGKCYGGSARISTMVKQIRAEAPNNTIFISAGDQFQGTMWFYVFGGTIMAKFMNLIGYEAMAVGNHEFDNGVSGLLTFARDIHFPLVSSNLNLTNTPALQNLISKVAVLDVGGERIGIVGYTTRDTSYLSKPETVTFTDEVKAVQAEVDKLTSAGINKIIALGHAGFMVDREIARSVRGLDIVVGGHTNTFLYNGEAPSNEDPEGSYPYVVTNSFQDQAVLTVQDFAYGKYLGNLSVVFDDEGKVTSYSGNPIILDSSVQKDPVVEAMINQYLPELEKYRTRIIGQSHVLLEHELCRVRECALGNLVTDAMIRQNFRHSDDRYWADVGIAIINSGGLRSTIQPGPVSMQTALEVLPFRNVVDIIEVKGQIIWDILEHGMSNLKERFGGFMQVAGLQYTFDPRKPVGQRLLDVWAVCTQCQVPKLEPLNMTMNYKLLLPNFIKEGGDNYDFIPKNIISEHVIGDLLSETLIDYINYTTPIYTGLEGRIRQLPEIENSDYILKFCLSGSSGLKGTLVTMAACLFCSLLWRRPVLG